MRFRTANRPALRKKDVGEKGADRQAIREILLATKPQLPDYWQPRPPTT
jgi:hypothetical protein